MKPKTLPKGSITDAVTKPGPRSVSASSCVAPEDIARSREGGVHVIDMPVDDGSARCSPNPRRREAPVDDAELGLVVTDAELDVAGSTAGRLAAEVGFCPQ